MEKENRLSLAGLGIDDPVITDLDNMPLHAGHEALKGDERLG
jgi:hypothetical protein